MTLHVVGKIVMNSTCTVQGRETVMFSFRSVPLARRTAAFKWHAISIIMIMLCSACVRSARTRYKRNIRVPISRRAAHHVRRQYSTRYGAINCAMCQCTRYVRARAPGAVYVPRRRAAYCTAQLSTINVSGALCAP